MSISAFLISIGMLISYEAGCTSSPYNCEASSCVSDSELVGIKERCNNMGCGACAPVPPEDECYKQYGNCVKTQDSCDWQENPQLKECLEKYRNMPKRSSVDKELDDILRKSIKGYNPR